MPDSLVIRLASAADAEGIEAVEAHADAALAALLHLDDEFEPEEALVRLGMPGFLLVAETDGEIVGFAHIVEDGRDALLEQLAVHPRHVRCGIGRALVAASADQARARGSVGLAVRTFDDVGASSAFHRACGFRPAQPRSAFHQEIIDAELDMGLDDLAPRSWFELPLT